MEKRLDTLLEYLEQHIDETHIRNTEQLYLDAVAYREIDHIPLATIFVPENAEPFPYAEAFEDPEKMLYNELVRSAHGTSTLASVIAKDEFLPQIRSNHGIGILASLFGANCKIVYNSMPWVEPISEEQIKKVIAHGVPDFHQALGQKVYDFIAYFHQRLSAYPKCARNIRITQPDLQGPFDIAHLLIGSDIFYWVYDEPEMLKDLLQLATDTYIGYIKTIFPIVNDQMGENAMYLHGSVCTGRALVKDDCAIQNLSKEMYFEFAKFYNEQILEQLQGASIHFCGKENPWQCEAIDSPWLRGVNYGNPELQNLDTLWNYWSPKKIPNFMWGDAVRQVRYPNFDYSKQLRDKGIRTGMTLTLHVNDADEAKRILEQHIENSHKA